MKNYLKPKLLINNTPIRNRLPNQVPTVNRNGQLTPTRINKQITLEHYTSVNNNPSPNKLQITRKPLPNKQYNSSRPALMQSKRGGNFDNLNNHNKALSKSNNYTCANHEQKQAEYKITIEGETMQYCQKCAAHLASQGFPVVRVNQKHQNNIQMLQTKKNELRQNLDPNLIDNDRYRQIVQFLQNLKELQRQFQSNSAQFQNINQHYNGQYQLIQQFYDAMIQYLKHVKSQHLNILKTQSRKYSQIAQIQCGEIEQNNADIEQIIVDIESNIESIVVNITQDKFRQCFNYYNQKFELYNHRAEEQKNTFEEITNIPKQQLENRLEQFRNTLNLLFGIKQGNTKKNTTQENQQIQNRFPEKKQSNATKLINIPSKKSTNHNQGPFRNLFEQDEMISDPSPQFKNL